jgi:hypothetical protein
MLVWLLETDSMSLLHYTLSTLVQQPRDSGGPGPKNVGRRHRHTPDLRALGLHGKGYQLALKSTSGHWQPPESGVQGSATVSTATISESCVFLS